MGGRVLPNISRFTQLNVLRRKLAVGFIYEVKSRWDMFVQSVYGSDI